MTTEQANTFISLVYQMRKAQKEYFRTRSTAVLQESKRLEKAVDKMLDEFVNLQEPTLF